MPDKLLRRSSSESMIAGVCGGVAQYFDLDPTVVRLAYVLITFFSAAFPGTLLYIILWAVIPSDRP